MQQALHMTTSASPEINRHLVTNLHGRRPFYMIIDARQAGLPIIFVSPGFSDCTGYTPREILFKHYGFLQGSRTDPEHIASLKEAVDTRTATSTIILNYKKSG